MSTPSGEQAAQWMRAIWGPVADLGEHVEITVKNSYGRWIPQHVLLADAEATALDGTFERIATFGADVYAGMAGLVDVPERGRGSAALRGHAACVWIDLDCIAPGRDSPTMFADQDEALLAVDSSPLGPAHVVVDSGWGIHAAWLITEAIPAVDVSVAVRALLQKVREATGKHVDEVSDLTRVLRLPGTLNWRGGESATQPVRLIRVGDRATGVGHSWDYIRAALGVSSVEIDEARERLTSAAGRSNRFEDRPLMDVSSLFEETISWAEVLEPAGWKQIPGAANEECWLRPGVLGKENHTRSGVVYTENGGGLMVVFSDAPEVRLVSLRKGGTARSGAGLGVIDKWRAWCDLVWDTDRLAASQDALERAWDDAGPGSWPESFYEALRDECDIARAWAAEQRRRSARRAVRGW